MNLKETLDALSALGVSNHDLGEALGGIGMAAVKKHRSPTKSLKAIPPEQWKPALFRLAKDRAAGFETVALRLMF
jgi:hypothetical protein